MKFAIADPPYFGMSQRFYCDHPEASIYDTLEGHAALIARLVDEYPDGWVLCMSSSNLRDILPLCPADVRVGAWVKPFASFKPGVGVPYAWEPVVFRGGRKRGRNELSTRDWVAASITMRRGFVGAKPAAMIRWCLDILNAKPTDTIDDLFPGSGAVQVVIDAMREGAGAEPEFGLFTRVVEA